MTVQKKLQHKRDANALRQCPIIVLPSIKGGRKQFNDVTNLLRESLERLSNHDSRLVRHRGIAKHYVKGDLKVWVKIGLWDFEGNFHEFHIVYYRPQLDEDFRAALGGDGETFTNVFGGFESGGRDRNDTVLVDVIELSDKPQGVKVGICSLVRLHSFNECLGIVSHPIHLGTAASLESTLGAEDGELGHVPSSGVKAHHPHNSLSEMLPAEAPPPSAPGTRRS